MKAIDPAASGRNAEVLLLLGIVIGLVAIAGFFWFWGRRDTGFAQRKKDVLLNQLTRVTDSRVGKTGLELYASYEKEADTTSRLLGSGLDTDQWVEVAEKRAMSLLNLIAMGSTDRIPTLLQLNEDLRNHADVRAQTVGKTSQWLLEFERQYVLCRHREIVGEIIASADTEENGESGDKLAARIRELQAADWQIAGAISELKDLLRELPKDNELRSNFDRFVSQLIEIETTYAGETSIPKYEDWIVTTRQLIDQYPDNAKIAEAIVRTYDRLKNLQCYDEANLLLAVAIEEYGGELHANVAESLAQLADRQSAAEIKLDRWSSMIRSNPQKSSQIVTPMVEGARKLIADKKVTSGIVDRYIHVLDTLEDSQQYESLAKARAELLPIFTTHEREGERFANYCAANSKRAALVGKPFALPSQMAIGQQLDPEIFKDRMTAVIFWVADEEPSFEMLGELDQLFTRHKGAGFNLLAINVDSDPQAVRDSLNFDPEWTMVVATGTDATGANPLAVEYGIRGTPYLVLVDSEGIVVDVSLTVRQMWAMAQERMPSLAVDGRQRRGGPVFGR